MRKQFQTRVIQNYKEVASEESRSIVLRPNNFVKLLLLRVIVHFAQHTGNTRRNDSINTDVFRHIANIANKTTNVWCVLTTVPSSYEI